MEDLEAIKPELNRIQQRALIIGVLGLALAGAGAFVSPQQFFRSYLFGYLFWIGLALGSLVILGLHHLVSGGWGFVIQRILEAASRTIPVLAVLFLPIFFGMSDLYIWARPDVVAADEILQHKSAYLNIPFFWIRAAGYFAVWSGFIYFLNKWSVEQDRTGDASLSDRLERIGGPSILFYVITMTLASTDWVMSLDPHWFSTIFGFIFVIGQVVLTMAFAALVLSKLAQYKPISDVIERKHFHDLGNLMLAFISLWAYVNVSQFLIIWSGNLPEEIPWYIHRMQGGWGILSVFVVVFHFLVPFVLLLMRRNKRRANVLAKIAVGVILVRFFDLYWIIAPNFYPHGIHVHWLDVVTPIGLGGIWVAAFIWQLKGRALLPVNDPRLQEAFAHE
ncbi:MAG: hypothetical protein O7G31_01150 [Calditrichaeota bacterium]|nr:hypothetical protein [Calditrichota bacterium]TDI84534.1 MAG: hypothetical protein E2O78_06135 [Caldithrix sp.]